MANDTLTLSGNGISGVQNNVNSSNATIQLLDNARAVVTGNSNHVSAGNTDSLGLYGNNNTATITGTGGNVWLSGTGDTVKASGEQVVVAGYTTGTINGDNDTVTLLAAASGSTLAINGSNERISLASLGGSITLNTGEAVDYTEIDLSVTSDHVWLQRLGSDLVLDNLGTGQAETIKNWFSDGIYEASIKASDGKVISPDNVSNLVQIMASFASSHSDFNPLSTTHTSVNDTSYYGTLAGSVYDSHGSGWR
jgi:hypothetical protein